LGQPFGTGGVVILLLLVDTAIYFDHKMMGVTVKIQDKMMEGELTSKFQPIQLFILQPFPQGCLGRCLGPAEFFSSLADERRGGVFGLFWSHG
jgi:hypothetical protein